MIINPLMPAFFQHGEGGHHIYRAVQLVMACTDEVGLDIFIMTMGDETPTVLDIEQTMAHAVAACKTNLKAHAGLITQSLPQVQNNDLND